MLRRLSAGLLATAAFVAPLAATAQEGSAEDLGVMSISLADVVKPTIGFQGALQGAGTPNQAGIGGFLPLSVGENSVWFLDALANVNFADRYNYSSIINTTVDGATISTSTRLGYRLLNGNRSWMYGINAGYDSRPMATGYADTGLNVTDMKTVFFQQVAVNAEAVSSTWSVNTYGLFPVGEEDHVLNNVYGSGALITIGGDVGYNITPTLKASVGGYYQNGDHNDDGKPEVDDIGLVLGVKYKLSKNYSAGIDLSHDKSFETRLIAKIQGRFGSGAKQQGELNRKNYKIIEALVTSPSNRNVRIHDDILGDTTCRLSLKSSALIRECWTGGEDDEPHRFVWNSNYIGGDICYLSRRSQRRNDRGLCRRLFEEIGFNPRSSNLREFLEDNKDRDFGISKYSWEYWL